MQHLLDFVVFLYFYLHAVTAQGDAPVVNTKFGQIRGKQVSLRLNNPYLRDANAYLGIPYAAPPTGSLRFREPRPTVRWNGIMNATSYGPSCPQSVEITENTSPWRRKILSRRAPFMESISEDCLYLNIFSPMKEVNRGDVNEEDIPRPVMVFIHDGNYVEGTGSFYDGSVLASLGDVIVVTINYRLGVLGFLSSGDDIAPGNYGLQDQIFALEWINSNIAEFGGNPYLVTVFGSGTGAACAQLLAMSNLTVGLIHRVIAQSGTATAPWVFAKEPITNFGMLTDNFQCDRETSGERVECLRHVAWEELIRMQHSSSRFYPAFGPVIDGTVISDDPWTALTNEPRRRRQSPYDNNGYPTLDGIPLLLGLVSSEAFPLIANNTDRHGRLHRSKYSHLLEEFVESMYGENTQASQQVSMAIDFEYTDWASGKNNPYSLRDSLTEAMTDRLYGLPIIQTAQLMSDDRKLVYLYSYGHRLKNGDSPKWTGATHGEELPFVFGAPLVNGLGIFQYNFSKSDALVSLAVIIYWTNFAKTGNPNIPVQQNPTDIHSMYQLKFRFENLGQWPRYTMDDQEFVHIGSSPKIRDFYRSHKLAFWTEYVAAIEEANRMTTTLTTTRLSTEGIITTTTAGTTSKIPVTTAAKIGVTYVLPSLPPGIEYNITRRDKKEKKDYATELSTVIAIGCGLLFLNLVGLATVVYFKDAGTAAAAAAKAAEAGGTSTVV
ncbi:neuroligin-4, X-linked-like [Ptychodera flava]|uniref:neuroligin-4, X-linked-like n=1 Tax=Ptychodera flava TaxID=63121 RepID=UPI00396A9F8B